MTLNIKKFSMREITFKPNENKGPVIVLIGRRDVKVILSEIYYIIIKIYQLEL